MVLELCFSWIMPRLMFSKSHVPGLGIWNVLHTSRSWQTWPIPCPKHFVVIRWRCYSVAGKLYKYRVWLSPTPQTHLGHCKLHFTSCSWSDLWLKKACGRPWAGEVTSANQTTNRKLWLDSKPHTLTGDCTPYQRRVESSLTMLVEGRGVASSQRQSPVVATNVSASSRGYSRTCAHGDDLRMRIYIT